MEGNKASASSMVGSGDAAARRHFVGSSARTVARAVYALPPTVVRCERVFQKVTPPSYFRVSSHCVSRVLTRDSVFAPFYAKLAELLQGSAVLPGAFWK